eukprot:365419-Chlamydomonas_euryale.AAC.1
MDGARSAASRCCSSESKGRDWSEKVLGLLLQLFGLVCVVALSQHSTVALAVQNWCGQPCLHSPTRRAAGSPTVRVLYEAYLRTVLCNPEASARYPPRVVVVKDLGSQGDPKVDALPLKPLCGSVLRPAMQHAPRLLSQTHFWLLLWPLSRSTSQSLSRSLLPSQRQSETG